MKGKKWNNKNDNTNNNNKCVFSFKFQITETRHAKPVRGSDVDLPTKD